MTRLWRWLAAQLDHWYTYHLWLPYHDRPWWPKGWWVVVGIAVAPFAALPIARHLYL